MKVALLGDIGFFGRFCVNERDDLKDYFSEVAAFLSTYDVVVGNLETPFSDECKPFGAKSAHIVSNKANVELLKYLNIKYVNLSNNHIFDYGKESYELTKETLTSSGVEYFGVESKQCYIKNDEINLALHGYCSYNTNPQMITFDSSIGISGLDVDVVENNLKNNHENGFFNIISVHSGQEHVNYPSQDDIKLARQLTKVVPYVYYGHHPHVVQGVEKFEESLLAYSLGNFCFSDVYTKKSKEPLIKQSDNNKTGMILSITLDENGVSSYEAIPIYMCKNRMKIGCKEVNWDLEKYSDKIDPECSSYLNFRNGLINNFLNQRKSMRDMNWFLKRLNLSSIKQIIQSKVNSRKYFKHVKSKLK